MMTFATDDVFHDAAGGVGRGREHLSDRTAWPALHVLLAPVCAGKDTVTGHTAGTARGCGIVWGECGKHRSRFPRRGSWGREAALTSTTSWIQNRGQRRSVDRLGFLQSLGVVSARMEAYTPQTSPEGCLGKNLILREH
jgi:hypothetical protein